MKISCEARRGGGIRNYRLEKRALGVNGQASSTARDGVINRRHMRGAEAQQRRPAARARNVAAEIFRARVMKRLYTVCVSWRRR